MAKTKVNVRFVLILGMALVTAVVIVGGLYVLNLRKDTARNIRRGDEAVAAGNLKLAFDNYGRAVHKEPGNMEAIRKLEDTVLKMVPQTADEAQILYRDRLNVLQHLARHNPTNATYHLNLLRELSRGARLGGGSGGGMWSSVYYAAEDMWKQLPEADTERPLAKMYSSMARFRMHSQKTREELEEAEMDAKTAVAALPNDDLAWANLIIGQSVLAQKLKDEGRSQGDVDGKQRDAEDSTEKAAQQVPDGPEVAKLVLVMKSVERMRDRESVPDEELVALSDRLVSLLTSASDPDPALISESADLLPAVPVPGGYERSMKLLEDYLEKHPDAIDKRVGRGGFRYQAGQLDEAEKDANDVLSAPTLPTSFLGQLQFEFRKRAGSLLVDVAHRRWQTASEEERPAKLVLVEEARNRLAALVIDPGNDPLVIRADAKIAYSQGDYPKATRLFERLARDPGGRSDEVLRYAAECLERVGEVGLAYNRLVAALEIYPKNPDLLYHKARMEFKLGRVADARATLNSLLESEQEREKPEVKQLEMAIRVRETGETLPTDDPAAAAIASANEAMINNDLETARDILLKALQGSAENFTMLLTLAQLELSSGQPEKAREYYEQARLQQPEHDVVKRLGIALQYPDPVEACLQYFQATIPDEADRAVRLAIAFDAMASRSRALTAALEKREVADPQERQKANEAIATNRDIAERAGKESATWTARARELAPDSGPLMEFQFRKAVEAPGDWATAELLIAKAKALNLDQADGDMYRGRMEYAKGNYREAARILETVTDRLAFSSNAWRLLAAAYQAAGNYNQALRAYERAYAANPLDRVTARLFVSVLVNSGDRTRALTVLRSAHALDPGNTWMRDRWLDMEAAVGDKVLAFFERRKIYKDKPDDRDNALALAELLGKTDPVREMILDNQGQVMYVDQRWLHMTAEDKAQAISKTRDTWRKESDEIIARLSKDSEDDLQFAVKRAQLLRARNDVDGGARVLQEYIDRHASEPNAQMYIELGRYLADNNHISEAIAAFEQAAKYQDPVTRDADLALGNLYMQVNKFDWAISLLTKVLETNPNRAIQLQLIECNLRLRNFDEAERQLKEVTANAPEEQLTTLLAANIAQGRALSLLDQGQTAAAERMFAMERETLARAEALDPANHLPRVLLAQSFLNEYTRTNKIALLDDALLQLEQADKTVADSNEASIVRVEVLRLKGNTEALATELQRMLRRNPDHAAARRDLTQVYVDAGQFQQAIKCLEEAIAYNPTLPIWHESLGDLLTVVFGNAEGANKEYAEAYRLLPNAGLFMKVMESALGLQKPDNAGVIREIERHPEYVAEMPRIRLLLARALLGENRRDDAIQEMRDTYADMRQRINANQLPLEEINNWFAILRFLFTKEQIADVEALVMEVTSNKPDVQELRLLARTWLQSGTGGHSRAQELQRQAIDACPEDNKQYKIELLRELADMHLVAGDFSAAKAAYVQVLDINPEFVDVLNNLSYMMAEDMGQAEDAVQYIERAVKLRPREPAYLDTRGWVYYRAGNLRSAEDSLRESLTFNNYSYEAHYHMAVVLAAKGDHSGALGHLKEAQELKPDPTTGEKIKALLDDIQNKR